ncbi:MAG: cell division protein FtsA, partial [Acidobacteria bacterium]|nr:cell division protein FtsA [Acidobacteriota bacterium]
MEVSLARKTRHVVGLDVGTTKTCTVICEVSDEGGLEVVGVGSAESRGLRRGVVVNLDGAVSAIKKSVEEAERSAGTSVESVFVG